MPHELTASDLTDEQLRAVLALLVQPNQTGRRDKVTSVARGHVHDGVAAQLVQYGLAVDRHRLYPAMQLQLTFAGAQLGLAYIDQIGKSGAA